MAKEVVKKEVVESEAVYSPLKKQNRFLQIGVIGLGVLLVVSVGFNIAEFHKKAAVPAGRAAPNFQNFQGGGGPGGQGFGGGAGRSGARGVNIQTYLNSDGSINTTAVKNTLDAMTADTKPAFLDRVKLRIDAAKTSGQITADQATKLDAAFGIASSSV
jgi:hypothetical protein